MKIKDSIKLLGRRVQWNPESKCSGAGNFGTIVGISLNHSIDNGNLHIDNFEDFYLQVAWDSYPQSTMGILPKDDTLIILEDSFETKKDIKEKRV